MIDQEKTRVMSLMAMMDAGDGYKKLLKGTYKTGSYVGRQLLIGWVSGTICYGALFFLWFALQWDTINDVFKNGDYLGFVDRIALYYVVFMVIYLAICAIVAVWKHSKYKDHRTRYTKYLRRLNQTYMTEEDEPDEFVE